MRALSLSILSLLLMQTVYASSLCHEDDVLARLIQTHQQQLILDDCHASLINDNAHAQQLQRAFITHYIGADQRVGYKLGLTNSVAQQAFDIDHPLLGVLYSSMLKNSPATIKLSSASHLLVEIDLLVKIRTEAIMQAQSIADVSEHIEEVIPFIELPDMTFKRAADNAALLLQASNVGTRWGVTGEPFKVEGSTDLATRMGRMRFFMKDENSALVSQGQGADMLGHPFNVILYLLKALKTQQHTVKKGDIVSLGAIGKPVVAKAGKRYTAEYHGLASTPLTVSVMITP